MDKFDEVADRIGQEAMYPGSGGTWRLSHDKTAAILREAFPTAPAQWAYDQACAALHKHEAAEKALREVLYSINIRHDPDGTWLIIDSGSLHATINLGFREYGKIGYDNIVSKAIENWRLKRAALLANETTEGIDA